MVKQSMGIEELAGRVRFTVFLRGILPLSPRQSRLSTAATLAQSGAQSARILFALSDIPLSASDLAKALDLESKSGAFKRSIKDLLSRELVEYTLPETPRSRLQKYRGTDSGRQWLEAAGGSSLEPGRADDN